MNVRERSLGKVSVVQIARAVVSQASCVEERLAWATGTFLRIFEIGRLWYVLLALVLVRMWEIHCGYCIPLTDDTGAHDESAGLIESIAFVYLLTHAHCIF